MRKSHTKGIFDAKFCKGILDAKAFTAAPLSAKVSTNGALSAKTSLQGVGTLALKSNFAAMNEGAAFAFDEMAKANSTESMDCHASRGALARNDEFGVNFTQNSHENSQISVNFSENSQKGVNLAENSQKSPQKRAQNTKTPPRSGFSAFGLSAVVAGLMLGATNAAALKTALSINSNQTIGGSIDLRYVPTALTETYFFGYTLNRTPGNILSVGHDYNNYNGFARNNNCALQQMATGRTGVSAYAMQETAQTCSQNNTGGTVFGIENWYSPEDTWNAIDISNGATVTINGHLNNIVFASYRRSSQSRNNLTGTDRLINLQNGTTLNITGDASFTAQNPIKIGFGTQNVWIRDNFTGNWGSSSMKNTNTSASSMNSMGQIIIDAYNATVNFNSPTKIITVLDNTGNEPWQNVTNTVGVNNFNTYKDYTYAQYHDNFKHRALRLTGNSVANVNAVVTTTGSVEVANTSRLIINRGQTLDIGRDLISSSASTTAVYNNGGTLVVGRNLNMSGGGRYAAYQGAATTVKGVASFNGIEFVSYYNSTFQVNDTLSLTNSNVGNRGTSGKIAFTVNTLSMHNSTFNANSHTMTATKSNLSGTNNFVMNVNSITTPVALGITTVSGADALRILLTDNVNSGTAAYTAATNAKKSSNKGVQYTYGDGTNGKTIMKGNGVNNSTVSLRDPTGNSALVTNGTVTQAIGLGSTRYQVVRDFTYNNGVTYYSATVTDLDTAYDPTVTPVTPPVNPDPGTPTPTPVEPSVPTTTSTELPIMESPITRGLADVNFLLAQFDVMSRYQNNFNPDTLVDNRKRTIRKQRETAGYDRRGRRVIKTTKKTRYTEYNYNVWGDAQYSNVTFDNGVGQNLQAQMLHNKVGVDITAGFDGYYRAYVGYNYLNAKNQANDNTYDGSSYEGGFQAVAELSVRKFNFKTYADVAYAYNNINIHAENRNAETGLATEVFDDKVNSHSIKVGVGVEKAVKLGRAFDVGAAVDIDYTLQMGKGFSIYTPGFDITTSTPDFQNHSLTPGVKLFGGYNFRRYGTYVYVQGTAAYQVLGQDEYLEINQNDKPWGRVANSKYQNMVSTAGIGVTQKIRRNFNISAAAYKVFSNAYTNNALQGRLQVSYRW